MTIDDNIRAELKQNDINRKSANVVLNAEKCYLLIKKEL